MVPVGGEHVRQLVACLRPAVIQVHVPVAWSWYRLPHAT